MKIRPEIEVFDDMKYCGDSATNNCSLLEDGENKYFCLWPGGKISLGQNKDKHDQCKAECLEVAQMMCFYRPHGGPLHSDCLIDDGKGFECAHAITEKVSKREECIYWKPAESDNNQ